MSVQERRKYDPDFKRNVVTTDSKHNEPIAPNLLERKFAVVSPDECG